VRRARPKSRINESKGDAKIKQLVPESLRKPETSATLERKLGDSKRVKTSRVKHTTARELEKSYR
jgi:hypothetical protein